MPKKQTAIQYYEAVGRRRESVARVRLYIANKKEVVVNGVKLAKGSFVINGKPAEEVYSRRYAQKLCIYPLELTDSLDRFVVSAHVTGGGQMGQLDAIKHGISRALVSVDESYKTILREHDLLTRDARTRQRRNVGTGGKARRKKQSPKR